MAEISLKREYRALSIAENKLLSKVQKSFDKEINSKLNWKAISILILLTFLCAVHIFFFDKSNWSLPSKFLIGVFPIIIWVIVENKFKGRKKKIQQLDSLNHLLDIDEIGVYKVKAKRIVKFSEYEDEGRLYLIETENDERFYLWDDQIMIPKSTGFPSKLFEIYTDEIIKNSIGRKLVSTGDKLEPLTVKGKDKWDYFTKVGFPGDLELEDKSIDELLERIKAHNNVYTK